MISTRGGRNLFILGVGSIIITVTTTVTSLVIYRISGDIYLDRSRPGYLPDENEVVETTETTNNYTFSESGPITYEVLTEYLKEFQKVDSRLDNFPDPYSPTPLSDESLGIPSEFSENPPEKRGLLNESRKNYLS